MTTTAIPTMSLMSSTQPAHTEDHDLVAWQETRGEVAFSRLVQRHSGLVAGVCRRRLRAGADVEEVAQAVFLILARRAGEIHPPGRLAAWLHGVPVKVCSNARRAAASRQRH